MPPNPQEPRRVLVHLVIENWTGFNPLKARSGNVAGSLAWTTWASWSAGDAVRQAFVHVRAGAERHFFSKQRLMHELEHVLDASFTNEAHHSALHFCTRSYNAIRFHRHCLYANDWMVKGLLEDLGVKVDRVVMA
jgi:hypothetical protein